MRKKQKGSASERLKFYDRRIRENWIHKTAGLSIQYRVRLLRIIESDFELPRLAGIKIRIIGIASY